MPNALEPEAEKIIGAKPQGRMMNARQAVATMSEGFLQIMGFMANEVGVPRDAMLHAMQIGQKYGLCLSTNKITPAGPAVHYINPYADLVAPPKPAPEVTPETPTEGEA